MILRRLRAWWQSRGQRCAYCGRDLQDSPLPPRRLRVTGSLVHAECEAEAVMDEYTLW